MTFFIYNIIIEASLPNANAKHRKIANKLRNLSSTARNMYKLNQYINKFMKLNILIHELNGQMEPEL